MTRTQLALAGAVLVLLLVVVYLLGRSSSGTDITVRNEAPTTFDCERALDENSSVLDVARRQVNC